jgi:hypothetical protein
MVAAVTCIAEYHFEAGARSFAAWCEMVAGDLGDWVRPYLGRLFPYVAHKVETYEALAKARPELASPPARQPTGEDRRLMVLCGVESLEDLELALSSPLIEEWLARQKPEDRQALEDWRHQLEVEEAALQDGWPAGRMKMPSEKNPTEPSTTQFAPLSDQAILKVKAALEDDQRLRQQFLKEHPAYLESRPPRASEPTISHLVDPGSTEAQKTSLLDGDAPANAPTKLPNETPKPSQEVHRILEFLVHADGQEFNAATAAILQGLKLKARDKERAYYWITENRHRFARLVFVDGQPRNRFEAAVVACAKRLMPDVERHFRSITWATQKVNFTKHRVAPHWAIADLLDERVDLDALAQKAVDNGLTSMLYTDHDPLLFLDRGNPQLPPWLPAGYDPPLTPVEMVEWFDQLLRREYGTSRGWPPNDDVDTRRREIVMCLYRMYIDMITGALQEPSFLVDRQRSQSPTRAPKKP